MRTGGETRRVRLGDGRATTVHSVVHPLGRTEVKVVNLSPEAPLEAWCEREGVLHAVSGGFTVKPEYEPLGELWVDGRAISHRPFGVIAGTRDPEGFSTTSWSSTRTSPLTGNRAWRLL